MKSDLGLTPEHGRHRDPRAAAAAHRGAPPRPDQGRAARGRERARRDPQRAPRRACTTLKEMLKEKLISRGRRAPRRRTRSRSSPTSYVAEIDQRARRERKGNDAGLSRGATASPRAGAATPRRHHHGRQRPLGRAARRCRATLGHRAGVKAGARDRRGVRAARRRGAHAVRLLAARTGSGPRDEVARPDGAVRRGARARGRRTARATASACASSATCARARARLRASIAAAEARTAGNTRLTLQIAVSYGGRWDIVQRGAPARGARRAPASSRRTRSTRRRSPRELALGGSPDPDLFIRTGGEQRISNFLLWNLAYTELYFTDCAVAGFRRRGVRARRCATSPRASGASA